MAAGAQSQARQIELTRLISFSGNRHIHRGRVSREKASFGRVWRDAAGSSLTSPVPLALLLLLDLPLEMLVGFGLLVLLQLSHVALLVPLRLVQVPLRREERRGGEKSGEAGVNEETNRQEGTMDDWWVKESFPHGVRSLWRMN